MGEARRVHPRAPGRATARRGPVEGGRHPVIAGLAARRFVRAPIQAVLTERGKLNDEVDAVQESVSKHSEHVFARLGGASDGRAVALQENVQAAGDARRVPGRAWLRNPSRGRSLMAHPEDRGAAAHRGARPGAAEGLRRS